MNPELPKVEVKPGSSEAHNDLDKAYGEASKEAQPLLRDPAELLRAGGSVGVEAGLTDFEAISGDDGLKSDSTADDTSDDNSQGNTAGQAPSVAKKAIGGAAVSISPVVAEDKDDIEKEWISKAKRIVEQTKSDPYLQERAVSRLQADYMKKRFNKEIKLSEGDD